LISDIYLKIVNDKQEIDLNVLGNYTLKNIEHVKKEMSNAKINTYIDEKILNNENHIKIIDTLKPAIEYRTRLMAYLASVK
jgi:hypothetical protein